MTRTVPIWIALVGLGSATLLAPARADACTCIPVTIESAWHNSSDTFVGIVLGTKTKGLTVTYKVGVQTVFGGCLQAGDVVFVDTPVDPGACGQVLTIGDKYLLTADRGAVNLSITSCGFNRLLSQLTASEQKFLESREVFCPDTGAMSCADGSQPLFCFVDPCTTATCGDPTAVCEANYCGGCNAEFYDPSGDMVCHN
jgi:Tissue inhibitor of metalloproteinase